MEHKVIERMYGPEVRHRDWEGEGVQLVYAGAALQMFSPGEGRVWWRHHPPAVGWTGGGDVKLRLLFQLTRVTDRSRFVVRFNAKPAQEGESGFRFVYGWDRIEVYRRDTLLHAEGAPGDTLREPQRLVLITLANTYMLQLNGRTLVEGATEPSAHDNEGVLGLELQDVDVELLSLTEENVARDGATAQWKRTQPLYVESFAPDTVARNWACNGPAPTCADGALTFRHRSNCVLRPRFDGPLAIDFTAEPVPDPEHFSAHVTDAIFLWMLDKPGDDVPAFLAALPDAELARLLPLNLYWVDVGGTNNTTTRLRRNPGRRLVRQFTDRHHLLARGKRYAVSLVQYGEFAEFWVDNRLWVRSWDPAPLRSGHAGFRAFVTDLTIRDLQVHRIEPQLPPSPPANPKGAGRNTDERG